MSRTPATTPPPDARNLRVSRFSRVASRLGIFLLLLALAGVGAALRPAKFPTAENLLSILRNVTLLGIVAVGVAFITTARHYVDLSIPSIMAFAGLAAISAQPHGIAASLAAGLAAGLAVGLINGAAIGYGRVNPILWTLAMAFLLDGLLRWFFAGRQVYPDAALPAGAFFLALSQIRFWGLLSLPTLIFIVLAAGGQWLMRGTRFGREVRLTGAAYEAARLSGVNVRRVVMLTFVLSAGCTSVAGLLLSSMSRQGTFDMGQGYDFNAVTAVVLGGVSLAGGRGSVLGVLGGVLVTGVLLNILVLLELGSYPQLVIKGAVFIAVVAATGWFDRAAGRGES